MLELKRGGVLLCAVEADDGRCFLNGDAAPVKGALCFTVVENVVRVKFRQRIETFTSAAGVHFSQNHHHRQHADRRQ